MELVISSNNVKKGATTHPLCQPLGGVHFGAARLQARFSSPSR